MKSRPKRPSTSKLYRKKRSRPTFEVLEARRLLAGDLHHQFGPADSIAKVLVVRSDLVADNAWDRQPSATKLQENSAATVLLGSEVGNGETAGAHHPKAGAGLGALEIAGIYRLGGMAILVPPINPNPMKS